MAVQEMPSKKKYGARSRNPPDVIRKFFLFRFIPLRKYCHTRSLTTGSNITHPTKEPWHYSKPIYRLGVTGRSL